MFTFRLSALPFKPYWYSCLPNSSTYPLSRISFICVDPKHKTTKTEVSKVHLFPIRLAHSLSDPQLLCFSDNHCRQNKLTFFCAEMVNSLEITWFLAEVLILYWQYIPSSTAQPAHGYHWSYDVHAWRYMSPVCINETGIFGIWMAIASPQVHYHVEMPFAGVGTPASTFLDSKV